MVNIRYGNSRKHVSVPKRGPKICHEILLGARDLSHIFEETCFLLHGIGTDASHCQNNFLGM